MNNKENLNNPDNYTFKMYELCHIKGCNCPGTWNLDEVFYLCDKHFEDLENKKFRVK